MKEIVCSLRSLLSPCDLLVLVIPAKLSSMDTEIDFLSYFKRLRTDITTFVFYCYKRKIEITSTLGCSAVCLVNSVIGVKIIFKKCSEVKQITTVRY